MADRAAENGTNGERNEDVERDVTTTIEGLTDEERKEYDKLPDHENPYVLSKDEFLNLGAAGRREWERESLEETFGDVPPIDQGTGWGYRHL